MATKFKSLLFFSLILASIALIAIKIVRIWNPFSPGVEIQNAPGKPLIVRDKESNRQPSLEAKKAELIAIRAEIDDKLKTLKETEANIVRMLQKNHDISPDDNSTIIIELDNADE